MLIEPAEPELAGRERQRHLFGGGTVHPIDYLEHQQPQNGDHCRHGYYAERAVERLYHAVIHFKERNDELYRYYAQYLHYDKDYHGEQDLVDNGGSLSADIHCAVEFYKEICHELPGIDYAEQKIGDYHRDYHAEHAACEELQATAEPEDEPQNYDRRYQAEEYPIGDYHFVHLRYIIFAYRLYHAAGRNVNNMSTNFCM